MTTSDQPSAPRQTTPLDYQDRWVHVLFTPSSSWKIVYAHDRLEDGAEQPTLSLESVPAVGWLTERNERNDGVRVVPAVFNDDVCEVTAFTDLECRNYTFVAVAPVSAHHGIVDGASWALDERPSPALQGLIINRRRWLASQN